MYLDASVLIPNVIKEASSPTIEGYLASAVGPLLVSTFAAGEVASATSRLVRMGAQSSDEGRQALVDFDDWLETDATLVDVEGGDVRLATAFVRRFELMLRTPDALHVAICQRLGARLVTRDKRLAAAAAILAVETDLL